MGGKVSTSGWVDDTFYVYVAGSARSEVRATGARTTGPEGLTLLTLATIWQGPIDVQLGWQGHLPWSADHGTIGSDELDVALLGGISTDAGPGRIGLTGGMAIMGNPLRFANQDDAPLLWLTGALPIGDSAEIAGRVGGALATARNPGRTAASLQVVAGHPWQVGLTGRIGLSPAAADLGGEVWLGYRWGCTAPRCD